jgi:membrane-bound lytic murein transglycosylase MltF
MKGRWFCYVSALVLLFTFSVPAKGAESSAASRGKKTHRAKTDQRDKTLLKNALNKKWTDDLDGMVKRRIIRVLVPYSKTFYFNDRGKQQGLAYDTFRLFEEDLNKKLKKNHIRVHVFFLPASRDKFIPYLLAGKGDIAAGNLTITPERLKKVDFSNSIFKDVMEIVVTGPASKPIESKEDLSGQEVYVRKSSSFYESMEALNVDFVARKKAPVRIRLAPESLEDEDLLEMVNAGLVKATIVDSPIAQFWKKIFTKIVLNPGAVVRTDADMGWMIRKNSPKLKAALNKFLTMYPEGSKVRNVLLQKYLKNTKYALEATSKSEIDKFDQVIDYFQKYGDQYALDYLLMMAQGYQESRLDHNVRSKAGAIGIMQVMPATGKEMKVGDIKTIEPNIHAGVKYVRFMEEQYYKNEPMDTLNKALFAFAAYNAGPNRIDQFRKLAAKRGLNPNVWFNNVELIAAEKIGRETVTYVSNIYKYYLAYQLVVEEEQQRREAVDQMKKEAK